MKKYHTIIDAIGNTPLIQLDFNVAPTILAKLEFTNPGGSIKDRSARYMIEDAERTGQLMPGGTIIDASSGNQGIAVAMIGAAKGYKVIITTTHKISKEKYDTLRAFGAEIILCPSTKDFSDPHNYHAKAVDIHKKIPNSFMPNQYFNTKNSDGHYHSLGPEIWSQTHGTVTHFCTAAGTGGHVSGAGKYLKEMNKAVKVIAFDAANSWYSTNGNAQPYAIEGMGIDFDSPVCDKSIIDKIIPIDDAHALPMLKTLAQKHGILAGLSSGAVAYGVQEYAKTLTANEVVVMIFGDSGRAYLTKNYY